jgi:hypothetical protein
VGRKPVQELSIEVTDVVKRELDKLMSQLLMDWTTGRRLMALACLAR